MCNFWTCIIDRRLKVHYDGNNDSHEEIIKKAGLRDDKLADRDFVRIEITPKKLSMDRKNWGLKVDEEETLPDWFVKNRKKAEEKCWKALMKYLKECHIGEVEKFIDSIKEVKLFSMKRKPKKGWKIFYGNTWSAADSAARSAAYSAADSAARSAADSAARSAVWSAALLTRFIIISDLVKKDKELQKHFKHAKDRWEVWTRGYGLVTEVNGVLYVYGVKKT